MPNIKLSEDSYIFMFYDQTTGEMGMSVAQDLEEFEQFNKIVTVVSYFNISGKDMEMTPQIVINELALVKEEV